MLTDKEVRLLREELASSQRPLFFYDDDPDGLCSFLLLYKIHNKGKGVVIKSSPRLDAQFVRKVEELHPDKIFVLDLSQIQQEFVDLAKKPLFWIDHHQPQQLNNVTYFNPRIREPDIYMPVSRMAFQVNEKPEDLWIAIVGCLADWYFPEDLVQQFMTRYPQLLPEKKDLTYTVYEAPVGKLVKIFSFLLKGSTSDVRKMVHILTKITGPEEILEQKTPVGKHLYKIFEKINVRYEALLKRAKKQVKKSKVVLFSYTEKQWSFTAELSNELSALYPDKVIIIARKKSEEMKCSLRAKVRIDQALEKALVGIQGYGGGHPNACGAVIKEADWKQFLKNFKKEVG